MKYVYDAAGEMLNDGGTGAGFHQYTWNAERVARSSGFEVRGFSPNLRVAPMVVCSANVREV